MKKRGFRFIEVIAPCSTLYARLNKLGTGFDLMRFYHDEAEVRHDADTRDVGVEFQKPFVCGRFVDRERPTFLDQMHAHYEKVLEERYRPMPPEGGWLNG